jgi:hypothetical protein
MAFKAMIDRVSVNGTVRWGKEHLYYEANRRALRDRRKTALSIGSVGGVACLFMCAVFQTWLPIGLSAFAAIAAWRAARKPYLPLTEDTFERSWRKWLAANHPTVGLIERPPEVAVPPRISEEDMAHYSFDRAVICDRARTVDLLLANNFHFENNCAVLGVKGYPSATFHLVRTMLRKNPRLQVFVLHDATPEGCNLARRLAADPEWFKGIGYVIDVGVRPHHARAFRGAWREPDPIADKRGLLPGEEGWLKEHTFELAAIRPEQVIKRLFKSMAAHVVVGPRRDGGSTTVTIGDHHGHDDGPDPGVDASGSWTEGSDASGSWADGQSAGGSWGADMDSFGGDADASDGGGDSFG